MTHDPEGRWRLIGTGFYVNDHGLFATARHVIEEVLQDGRQVLPLGILHLRSETGLFGPTEALMRPVRQCWLSEVADVALGVAASVTDKQTGESLTNWTWALSWRVPAVGSPAATFAFPNHAVSDDGHRIRFAPDVYAGFVQGSGKFRDRVMLTFPYLQADFRIHGGASGGPILSGRHVVGINCTESPVNLDHPPGPAFGAQCRCLADAFLDDVLLPTEGTPLRVTFDELVCAGSIAVPDYKPQGNAADRGGALVRFDQPPTASLPAIEIGVYV